MISSTCCVLPQKRKPTELPPRPHHAAATIITTPSLGSLELLRLLLLEEHPLPNQVHKNLKVGDNFLFFFLILNKGVCTTNKNIIMLVIDTWSFLNKVSLILKQKWSKSASRSDTLIGYTFIFSRFLPIHLISLILLSLHAMLRYALILAAILSQHIIFGEDVHLRAWDSTRRNRETRSAEQCILMRH